MAACKTETERLRDGQRTAIIDTALGTDIFRALLLC